MIDNIKLKSSIELDDDSYFDVERVIKKIADENDIKNVKSVEVDLTSNKGLIKFNQVKDSENTEE